MKLGLAACEVKELEFLRSAQSLIELDLSNNKIQGRIPDWAWTNWEFSVSLLNLSHNILTSMDLIPLQLVHTIDLRSNFLEGSLPILANFTRFFFVSENNLSGEISSSLCNLMSLKMLVLAKITWGEKFHNVWVTWVTISRFWICTATIFQGLFQRLLALEVHLEASTCMVINYMKKIPRSLVNCKSLQVLDLGDNHLNYTFPMWLGTLPDLQVLSLRSNNLHGSFQPSEIGSMFPKLRMIDLSHNAFWGNLPTSLFRHVKPMRTIDPLINEEM